MVNRSNPKTSTIEGDRAEDEENTPAEEETCCKDKSNVTCEDNTAEDEVNSFMEGFSIIKRSFHLFFLLLNFLGLKSVSGGFAPYIDEFSNI